MSTLEVTDYAERNLIDRLLDGPRRGARIDRRRTPLCDAHLDRSTGARRATAHRLRHRRRAAPRERRTAGGPHRIAHARVLAAHGGRDWKPKQDFRDLVDRARRGRTSGATERSRERAARRRERAHATPASMAVPASASIVEAQSKAQYARHRARRARGDRAHPAERCRRARASDRVDNAVAIEAALHEVLIAVVFALDLGARRDLRVPRQPARDA